MIKVKIYETGREMAEVELKDGAKVEDAIKAYGGIASKYNLEVYVNGISKGVRYTKMLRDKDMIRLSALPPKHPFYKFLDLIQ